MQDRSRLIVPLAASLTLGLAPFLPQPHLVEKIRWLIDGRALAPIDVFDLMLHGAPWLWLVVEVGALILHRRKAPPARSTTP